MKARVAGDDDRPTGGRLRLHGPRAAIVSDEDWRRSLADKKHRRTVHLHAVLASGAADFEAVPGREQYGDDAAEAERHEQAFNDYVDGNFDDRKGRCKADLFSCI